MFIREYQTSDCSGLAELFYNTVHTINAKDYSKEQLDVWATGQINIETWDKSLQEHYSLVAVDNEIIVGFGDIDSTGYLDRLYVHRDYQGKGIATALCNKLESAVTRLRIYRFLRLFSMRRTINWRVTTIRRERCQDFQTAHSFLLKVADI